MQDNKPYRIGQIYQWGLQLTIFLAIIQCIGQAFNILYLRMIKPLPIAMMILYLTESILKNTTRNKKQIMSKWVVFGLLFSIVGDVLLMFSSLTAFMVGTGFFLVAHFLYIWSCRLDTPFRQPSPTTQKIIDATTIILILAYIGNIVTLWDKFPNKILYVIYGWTICFLTIFAVRRYKRTNEKSYLYFLIGAILFTTSDTLIGFLKFNNVQTDIGRVIIMVLYYSAQYFIMHGSIFNDNQNYNFEWCRFVTNKKTNLMKEAKSD